MQQKNRMRGNYSRSELLGLGKHGCRRQGWCLLDFLQVNRRAPARHILGAFLLSDSGWLTHNPDFIHSMHR